MAKRFPYRSKVKKEHIICSHPECENNAQYPAPKSRPMPDSFEILQGYLPEKTIEKNHDYYCLEHIRAFNKGYNFFGDMDSETIEAFQKDARTGHRQSKQIHEKTASMADDIYNQAWHMRNGDKVAQAPDAVARPIQDALEILGLSHPTTQQHIAKAYRQKIKLTHPDIAGEKNIAQFHAIQNAFDLLKQDYA